MKFLYPATYPDQRGRSAGNTAGAILTELSVLLPLTLFLGLGLVDAGNIFWEENLLSAASRHGARSAGSYAKSDPTICTQQRAFTLRCDEASDMGGGPFKVEELAAREACLYLGSSGVNPADWEAKVNSYQAEESYSTTPLLVPVIEVDIQSLRSADCTVCVGSWAGIALKKRGSVFPLEC